MSIERNVNRIYIYLWYSKTTPSSLYNSKHINISFHHYELFLRVIFLILKSTDNLPLVLNFFLDPNKNSILHLRYFNILTHILLHAVIN